MARDPKRAERLVSALKKLHRVEELKKIELERQLREIRRSEEDIIMGLNHDDALHGVFIDTTTRFLRSLARQAEKVSQSQQHQSRRLLDRAGKLRRAEKLRDKISQQKLHAEGEKHLAEVIERYGGKGTSLP
jgi:hypothetical protein